MPAEDLPLYEHEPITEESPFDELAKGVAKGTLTRGQALKTLVLQ
jgi:hypothetical protein